MSVSTHVIPVVSWLRADQVPTDAYWVHDEHYPDPLTPLYADFGPGNLSDDADLEELATPVPTKRRIVVDGYMYTGVLTHPAPPTTAQIAAFEQRLGQRHEREIVRRWFAEIRPVMVERHTALCAARPAAMDDAALLSHIRTIAADARSAHRAHALNVRAVSLVTWPLEQFCADQLGLSTLQLQELLAGSSAATGGGTVALEDLAAKVLTIPEVRAALAAADARDDTRIQALLQPFVDAFGHRLLQPDFIQPTLAEQPEVVVSMLREAVARLDSGAGRASASVRERATTASDELRQRLPDDADRQTFDRLLADARSVHGIREDDQAFLAELRGFLRYALLEAGRRLVRQGTLDGPDHVWYLRRPELEAALSGAPTANLHGVARQRLAEHRRQRAQTPRAMFGSPPAAIAWPPMSSDTRAAIDALGAWTVTARHDRPAAPAERVVLPGMGASRGTFRGPARIVGGPEEFDRVQPGDVLVCKISSPAWTIIFGRIGGIVTEVGSVLSHPAIAAREFGIPAVLGVPDATTRIPDGQIVHIDGEAGTVQLVPRERS